MKKHTQKTTQAKQDERELVLAYKDLRYAAYKVGSNIYQWNREGKFKLEKFNGDANKVAKEVNIMMGVAFISGREIQKCY